MREGRVVRVTGVFQPVGVFDLRVGDGVPAGVGGDCLVQVGVLLERHESVYELCPGRVSEHAVFTGLVPGFFLHIAEYGFDNGVGPLFFGKRLVILEHVSLDIFARGVVILREFQGDGNGLFVLELVHPGSQVIVGISSGSGKDEHDRHTLDIAFRDVEMKVDRLAFQWGVIRVGHDTMSRTQFVQHEVLLVAFPFTATQHGSDKQGYD